MLLNWIVVTALQLCKFAKKMYKVESYTQTQGDLGYAHYTSVKQPQNPETNSGTSGGTDGVAGLTTPSGPPLLEEGRKSPPLCNLLLSSIWQDPMAGAEEAGGPLRNHWTNLSHTEAPQMMGESWGGALKVIPLCTGCSKEPAPRSHSGGLGWTARLTLTHEWQRRREHRPTRGSGCAVHRKTEKTARVQQSRESCPDNNGTPWKYSKVKRVTGQPATWKRR